MKLKPKTETETDLQADKQQADKQQADKQQADKQQAASSKQQAASRQAASSKQQAASSRAAYETVGGGMQVCQVNADWPLAEMTS